MSTVDYNWSADSRAMATFLRYSHDRLPKYTGILNPSYESAKKDASPAGQYFIHRLAELNEKFTGRVDLPLECASKDVSFDKKGLYVGEQHTYAQRHMQLAGASAGDTEVTVVVFVGGATSTFEGFSFFIATDSLEVYNLFKAEAANIDDKILVEKKEKNTIQMVTQNSEGLSLASFQINRSMNFDLDGYNDDAVPFFDGVRKVIDEKRRGLILLHGTPGTGKTSYIRNLITDPTNDREVIYLPPEMASVVASPGFVKFAVDSAKGAIIIIEDAETILMTREAGGTQAVANLLNLTDGILGDMLEVLLICTLNTDIEDVDQALRRPGRLLAEYHFGALSKAKSQKMIDKLYPGKGLEAAKDMTLAEIHNMTDEKFIIQSKKHKAGFMV